MSKYPYKNIFNLETLKIKVAIINTLPPLSLDSNSFKNNAILISYNCSDFLTQLWLNKSSRSWRFDHLYHKWCWKNTNCTRLKDSYGHWPRLVSLVFFLLKICIKPTLNYVSDLVPVSKLIISNSVFYYCLLYFNELFFLLFSGPVSVINKVTGHLKLLW